jgi:CRP/FNR family transcriptional regulator
MTHEHTAERFYVIVAGRLKVCRVNPQTGREVGLLLLGPGDALDIVSLIDGEPLAACTEALDDLEVVSAPLARVREWKAEHRAFDRALHRYLARQIRSLANLASELVLYDTDVRLARLIVRHVARDSDTALRPIEHLSHETLASLIGSVRVVVNRHNQDLKRGGIISTRRGQLSVNDLESLVERCQSAEPRLLAENRSSQPESQISASGLV